MLLRRGMEGEFHPANPVECGNSRLPADGLFLAKVCFINEDSTVNLVVWDQFCRDFQVWNVPLEEETTAGEHYFRPYAA